MKRTIKFCDKVRFADSKNIHKSLLGVDFCVIGMDENAFALIEWDKRGEYNFHYYTGNPQTILIHSN